ncbi:MAG: hypothetical protein HGA47_04805, partial [Zoogloea sp.]|nr:hypothetical protein [Zoogloea sp.]
MLGYLVFASVWILFSDWILTDISEIATVTRLSTLKGLAFVLLSSVLLVLALRAVPPRQRPAQAPTILKSRPWGLLLVFLLLFAIFAGIGVLVFRAQSDAVRQGHLAELQAVARLKTEGIGRWLEERQSDAQKASRNPVTLATLARWLERGAARERDSLAGELRSWQASHGYDQAVLLNAAGDAVLV